MRIRMHSSICKKVPSNLIFTRIPPYNKVNWRKEELMYPLKSFWRQYSSVENVASLFIHDELCYRSTNDFTAETSLTNVKIAVDISDNGAIWSTTRRACTRSRNNFNASTVARTLPASTRSLSTAEFTPVRRTISASTATRRSGRAVTCRITGASTRGKNLILALSVANRSACAATWRGTWTRTLEVVQNEPSIAAGPPRKKKQGI